MYNKNIIWIYKQQEESFTGEYIRNWCLYHKDNNESVYAYDAECIWDKYFGEGCNINKQPSSKVYYFIERTRNYNQAMSEVWLTRDEEKSPRKYKK